METSVYFVFHTLLSDHVLKRVQTLSLLNNISLVLLLSYQGVTSLYAQKVREG